MFLCAMSVSICWSVYVTCWPCIRDLSIVIFDGKRIYGYDFWGQKTSILKCEVEDVAYRWGGASVRTKKGKVWIPISLLDTSQDLKNSVKALLDAAAGPAS